MRGAPTLLHLGLTARDSPTRRLGSRVRVGVVLTGRFLGALLGERIRCLRVELAGRMGLQSGAQVDRRLSQIETAQGFDVAPPHPNPLPPGGKGMEARLWLPTRSDGARGASGASGGRTAPWTEGSSPCALAHHEG